MSDNAPMNTNSAACMKLFIFLITMCQCRGEGAYALENASESREVELISSDLRSEATEEEGIGSTSRDEDAFLVCKHPSHGINIVIRKNSL